MSKNVNVIPGQIWKLAYDPNIKWIITRIVNQNNRLMAYGKALPIVDGDDIYFGSLHPDGTPSNWGATLIEEPDPNAIICLD